jgi:methionyl-tRNA formyltransferase
MKNLTAVFLMSEADGNTAYDLAKQAEIDLDVVIVSDLNALEHAFSTPRDLLLSFGTGIIVPPWILAIEGLLALNVHAASPEYPGRDPHHFAVYDGAKRYGATMHYMSQSVDSGPISDIELFDVPNNVSPIQLLELANDSSWILIQRFFSIYKKQGAPSALNNVAWGKRKTTRKMFSELCKVDCAMSEREFERRLRSTTIPGYDNLYLELHGRRFRLDKK